MSTEISLSEVKKHKSKKSLWIVIHDQVYDVTKYLQEHPGGEEPLLENAGTNATQAFEDVGHSVDARELLKKFQIGVVPPGEKEKSSYCCKGRSESSPNLRDSSQGILKSEKKTWRTFDGTSTSYHKPNKDHKKSPSTSKVERRVQAIVVPRERHQREMPCERWRPPPPPSSSGNLKWAIAALAGAIVIGIVLKKYLG